MFPGNPLKICLSLYKRLSSPAMVSSRQLTGSFSQAPICCPPQVGETPGKSFYCHPAGP